MTVAREIAFVLGAACVIAGIWGYDYRAALIVGGSGLAFAGWMGIKNDSGISRPR